MAKPLFRADHVGSLLRPPEVKEARTGVEEGRITAAQLREIEDRAIERAVRRQEEIGLQLATDGEIRRAVWSADFFVGLDGVEPYVAERGVQFHGITSTPKTFRVCGRIGFSGHPMLEHFRFLDRTTRVTAKMTIPSPTVAHFRTGKTVLASVYPDLDQFYDDMAAAYGKAIRAFYDAGCRYLQLDDTVWAYLCSEEQRERARRQGDDPDRMPEDYARMLSTALAARPADMVITTHLCRGNFRSSWVSEGGYEPVAERLLGGLDYDGYFLEYDTERAGGFEPLRFLPKGKKRVVLGLITSKTGALEAKDDVKRRVDEAAKFADLDQLCLSPQCGFASTEEGNVLTEDEQWAKLALVVEIAREVWGET